MNDYHVLKVHIIERDLRDRKVNRQRVFNPTQHKKRWAYIKQLLHGERQLQD